LIVFDVLEVSVKGRYEMMRANVKVKSTTIE